MLRIISTTDGQNRGRIIGMPTIGPLPLPSGAVVDITRIEQVAGVWVFSGPNYVIEAVEVV